MSDLELLLEAVDEAIAAEDLALAEIKKIDGTASDFACPHIERLREVRAKFPAAS